MKNDITSSPITWLGSKSRLVKKIIKYFPIHTTFVDVFGGSGAVLLGKKPSKVEIYNDINYKLVSLFRVLSNKEKTKELIQRLEFTPYSRSEFEFCKNSINNVADEIELAKMLIVIQRQSHSGLAKSFGTCITDSATGCSSAVRKFHAGIDRLKEVHYRLRRVQVENMHWEDLIKRYDKSTTLFYLDPPYVSDTRVDGKYEYEMTNTEHKKLIEQVLEIKGHAVLSGYMNNLYKPLEKAGWVRIEIETVAYSSQTRTKRIECLWLSPNSESPKLITNIESLADNHSKRQIHAYQIHKHRTTSSEELLKSAIRSLKTLGKRVTKTEVSRLTGISRVHISRRYSKLFE